MCFEKTKVVVLGYRLCTDGSMDPILKERLDFAVALADSLGDCFGGFVLSGGRWIIKGGFHGPTEAEVMWGYLHKQHRVPLSQVQSEDESRTTVENASHLFRLKDKLGLNEFIVVTSWSHRRRARKIFSKVFGKQIEVRSAPFKWNEWRVLLLSPVGCIVSNFELLKLKYKSL